jgi:hypothetical protein
VIAKRPGARALLAAVGALVLAGCGDTAALRVGDVSFSDSRLLGLSESQVDLLAAITVVGLATSLGELDVIGERVLARQADDRRVQLLRDRFALARSGIDEAALRTLYERAPEPELIVRHLVVLSERWRSAEHREEARGRAATALRRVRTGEPFATVAGEVSDEPGAAERGGLLGAGREGTWVREFWEAAQGLAEGEVSEVVETEYGFHVLRLEERRAVPFEEARHRFASRVATGVDDPDAWEAQLEDWIEGMRMDEVPGPEVSRPELARRVALEEAARMGVSPTAEDMEELRGAWEALAGGWGAALGFTEGMPPEGVADQALVALGRTDQSARIAREEIASRSDELLAAYPIERPSP